MSRRLQQLITSFCLVLVIGLGLIQPHVAAAKGSPVVPAGGFPTFDLGLNLANTQDSIGNIISDILQAMIRNALNAFLGKLAYDSAVYLASGGEGQGALVYDKGASDYLKEAGDAAVGGAIEGLATGAGLDAQGLCDPGADFRISLTLGLDLGAQSPYRPACTLTKLVGNWKEAFSDPDFSKLVALQFDPTANPLGIAMEAGDITLQASIDAEEAAKLERTKTHGLKDKTELVSGTTLTSAEDLEAEAQAARDLARKGWTDTLGNPFVDAISVFASTLVSKWMERFQNGIANLSNGASLASLVSGESAGASTGRSAAEATFGGLRQPAFSATGAFDILAELGNCPSDDPTAIDGTQQQINNCALGPYLQNAVSQKWTVQQFADYLTDNGAEAFSFGQTTNSASYVTGNAGLTYKGILLLKKYRIVPVGWELAAEYIKEQYPGSEPTLQNLVDCYNACGAVETAGNCSDAYLNVSDDDTKYSPFCKLVDPDWVLKAPQNFCEREAAGPDFAAITSFESGNAATQDSVLYSRLNYCADNRACIQEDEEDVCTAYGYCTTESSIYRFDGTSCEAYYSSCQTFENSDGDEQSVIKSSINYDDCATDPGCQWYCLSQNDVGEFDCAGSFSTFASCDDTTSDSYDITYAANESCSCELEETCTVLAGSDLGYDGGDPTGVITTAVSTDGIYDYWQCPITNSDGSTTTCALDSTCGAGSPNYDPTSQTCTCILSNTCDVNAGATTCAVGETGNTCTLVETNANGCESLDETYSSAPTCEAATTDTNGDGTVGSGYLNCGDTCTVADGDTTCVNSLGNTCTDGDTDSSDGATDSDGTVNGSCTLVDSCAVTSGSFSCTSDASNTCVIGVITEDPAESNDTQYFDSNVESCDSGDAGCHQYIRQLSDTNLISNSYFDYYSGTTNDSNQDYLAFCSNHGEGCYTDTDCTRDADGDNVIEDGDSTGTCVGWNQDNAAVYAQTSDSGVTPTLGSNFARLATDGVGNGAIEMVIDTGHSLSNRTFTFAYSAASLLAESNTCTLSFTIGDDNGNDTETVTSFITAAGTTASTYYSTDWQDYYVTHTFPDEGEAAVDLGNVIRVSIAEDDTCDIDIEGAYLAEIDAFDGDYGNYGVDNLTYLNSDTISCEPEDVGCELYTEIGNDEDQGVPGIITNPNSDACLGTCSDDASTSESDCRAAGETWDATAYNFDSPSCNQCDGDVANGQDVDFYNGCGFYQESALDNTTPIVTDETWLDDDTERPGVTERSGQYCSYDSATHCFDDLDCDINGDGTSDGDCQAQLSIVPSSATQCAAADVGCAAYTNLDAISAGGESLEYYSELKQCVKTNDPDIATYHTFEGSDVGGIQINDYVLKQATSGAPCTHLNLSDEEYNATCTDGTTATANDCGPDGDLDGINGINSADANTDDEEYGTDPDCRQFIDDSGNVYYRYESEVVEASDSCIPLRNADDTRVYYAITGSSDSCAEPAVGCREYLGTNTGSAQEIVNTGFDDDSTEDWAGASSTSNESPLSTGYSLLVEDADSITYDLFDTYTDNLGVTTDNSLLTAGYTYVLNFWAKAEGACSDTAYTTKADCENNTKVWTSSTGTFGIDLDSSVAGTDYYFTTSGMTTDSTLAAVTLDSTGIGGWQSYQIGPIILPVTADVDDANELFAVTFDGATASSTGYLDNIIITQSDSQYLIQDTADTCISFEGCREYNDRADDTHYLKSFQRLCDEDAVGCEAMIDTANSTNPYTESYNFDNEYETDNVIVQYDQPVTLVYDEDNLCAESAMGCTELGLPAVDERTGTVSDFTTTYLLDRPDDYLSILCHQEQLACAEFTSDYDGTAYFKDPGEKICLLQDYTDTDGLSLQGWFKQDSTASQPDCPVQYSYDSPSQPLGGVCNSNSVHHEDDSSTSTVYEVATSKIGELCNQDADCYPDDWASTDPTPRCISSVEDDIDLYDGGVHQYVIYPDDGVTLSDYTTDFGWVGQCPADQSGCSEYVDPYSPNIDEINKNWSFENDVRDTSSLYYASTDTPDGYPDYWSVLENTTAVASGTDPETGATLYTNTEIDLDLNGSIDFTTACGDTTASAIMTNSDAYTGTTVAASDGGSALALTECVLDNLNIYTFDPAKLYTLRAFIKLPSSAYADDTSVTTDDPIQFSIGLQYYDEDYNQIIVDDEQTYLVANHATIDSADYVDDDTDGLSKWYRWEGNIGLGSTVEWPTTARYVRVFVANHSATTLYLDEVSFKENDKYYYIDYTVDGTSEKEATDGSNTCINQSGEAELTSDGGCVAFRDITSDTQNYSQEGLEDCTSCLLTTNSDSCRNVVDACDTNAVLKVQPDRICSEWIGCDIASIVPDEAGNESTQCFTIKPCNALDANGRCSSWVQKPTYDELNSTTDLSFTTNISDNDSLSGMRGVTGYADVGMVWSATRVCEDGELVGDICTADSDCTDTATCTGTTCSDDSSATCSTDADCNTNTCATAFSTDGYYPYGFMVEVGTDGSTEGEDLIEMGDFEDLFCAGIDADPSLRCITNASISNATTASAEAGNCFSTNIEEKFLDTNAGSYPIAYNEGQDFEEVMASAEAPTYYCPNSPDFGDDWPFGGSSQGNSAVNFTRNGWQKSSDSSNVVVTQYTTGVPDCGDNCPSLDVNNVLEITPGDSGFAGGVEYDVADNIIASGNYVLSFDGRYTTSPTALNDDSGDPSTMSVCLRYVDGNGNDVFEDSLGNPRERKDCFLSGLSGADIVFVIDTSSTMDDQPYTDTDGGYHETGGPIGNVPTAVANISSELLAQGINVQFALVDMEDTDTLRQNFTSDVSVLTSVLTSDFTAVGANVDPYKTLDNVINNNIDSYDSGNGLSSATLDWRPSSQPIIVLVTDLNNDEITNAFDPTTLATLLQTEGSHYPLMVVTGTEYDSDSVTGWQTYADYTGGDVSSQITSASWTTGTDPVATDIINLVTGVVETFQMDTIMRHYSFGPLTTTQREEEADVAILPDGATVTAVLEILLSDTKTIQLDNISMLPGLEVNKDLDPIGRLCRAYPDATSAQCDYIVAAGGNYQGWKGYCMQIDPTNNARCLTWWPQDILTGEESIVTRSAAGYTDSGGATNVYHCVVSKGLSQPGFCDTSTWGDSTDTFGTVSQDDDDANTATSAVSSANPADFGQDVLCSGATADNTCSAIGSGTCFQGANYNLTTDSGGGDDGEHNNVNDSSDIVETLTSDGGTCDVQSSYEVSCDSWSLEGEVCLDAGGTLLVDADDNVLYTDETSCTDASADYTWATTVDIIDAYGGTGVCQSYTDGGSDGIDPAVYGETNASQFTATKYCFYDLDDNGVEEIRSTLSCDSSSDCRSAPTGHTTSEYSCAPMQCANGSENKQCTAHPSQSDTECETVSAVITDLPYYTRPLRWQMPDPYDRTYNAAFEDYLDSTGTLTAALTAACLAAGTFAVTPECLVLLGTQFVLADASAQVATFEKGVVMRLPANELMRNIHVSEMETIGLGLGDASNGNSGIYINKYWGQQRDTPYNNIYGNAGDIWLTDFATGAIPYDEDDNLAVTTDNTGGFDHCLAYYDNWPDDIFGFGCRIWGLYDSGFKLSGYAALSDTSDHANDLVYTWAWSNFQFSKGKSDASTYEFDCNTAETSATDNEVQYRYKTLDSEDNDLLWFESPCVNQTIKTIMNSNHTASYIPDITTNSNPWDHFTGSIETSLAEAITSETPAVWYFDRNDIDGWEGWANYSEPGDGGNIFSVFVDFNSQGYIQAVYTLIYFAADNTQQKSVFQPKGIELTWADHMDLGIQTRESCALISNAVDGSGGNYAWSDRTIGGSYEIHTGATDAYGRETETEPFGRISSLDGTPVDTDSWDPLAFDSTFATSYYNLTYGTQTIAASEETVNSGTPLACIGDCSTQGCVADPENIGNTCDSCNNGICMGVSAGDSITEVGQAVTSYANLDAQLKGVSRTGVTNLKHVFAGLPGSSPFFRLLPGGSYLYDNVGTDFWSSSSTFASGYNLFFDNMTVCAGTADLPGQRTEAAGVEGEYCGVLPKVSDTEDGGVGISIDGYANLAEDYGIGTGETIQLAFTSITNTEQKPLKWVSIDWGDGTDPATEDDWGADDADFIYTHAYNCDPGYADYEDANHDGATDSSDDSIGNADGVTGDADDGCTFLPKITLVDNWGWCSGDQDYGVSTIDHRHFDDVSSSILADCGSYDDPGFSIQVSQ